MIFMFFQPNNKLCQIQFHERIIMKSISSTSKEISFSSFISTEKKDDLIWNAYHCLFKFNKTFFFGNFCKSHNQAINYRHTHDNKTKLKVFILVNYSIKSDSCGEIFLKCCVQTLKYHIGLLRISHSQSKAPVICILFRR